MTSRRSGTARRLRSRRSSRGAAGSRNAPPNIPFPGFLNTNATQDVSVSVTKVAGRHTLKAGFYNTHSYKARAGDRSATRSARSTSSRTRRRRIRSTRRSDSPTRRSACFSSYQQASKYVEGDYVYNNIEGLHPGQLEGEQQADARLRRAPRAPAAAVRYARAGDEFPARRVGAVGSAACCTCRAARSRGAWNRVPGGEPAGEESG